MPQEQLLEGFILKQQDLGEADSILTFFSKEQGKIRAVIKAAKRMTSKLQGRLQPYSQTRITVVGKSNLTTVIGVELVRQFSGVLANESALHAIAAVQELLQRALPDAEANPQLYALTERYFTVLHASEVTSQSQIIGSLLQFYIQALETLGLAPKHVDTATAESVYFLAQEGGFSIESASTTSILLSRATYDLYMQLAQQPLSIPQTFTDMLLFRVIVQFAGYQLDRELRVPRYFLQSGIIE